MKPIRDLIHELHRRSLWQVLGIYLAGSWAALEVTGALTDAAGLPGWFPSFALGLLILGLPVVIATAFVQKGEVRKDEAGASVEGAVSGPAAEADREGVAPRTGARPTGHSAASVLTWRNAVIGGVAALVLWAAVATALLLRAESGARPAVAVAADTPAVAVLPLANFSSRGADDAYIAAGLHDEILTRLQQVGGLLVKSRTSVMRYEDTTKPIPEIARELGVDAVLEASLRRVGDQLRVTAQLIDGETDDHLWADSFDRVLTERELMAVQSDVALAIAEGLKASLSPGERDRLEKRPTDDPTAHRSYLLGLYYRNRGRPGDLGRSLEAFDQAIEQDPGFARAYAAKAESYMVLAHTVMPPWEAFPLGEEAARQALSLDPDLAAAHTVLADTRYHYHWDWEGAEAGFRRALELNPNHATAHWWYAGLLTTLRRHDEAIRRVRLAQERDMTGVTYAFGARVAMWADRPELAERFVGRGLDVNPSHAMLLEAAGQLHTWFGDRDTGEALRYLNRAVELGPGPHVVSRGIALARTGRTEEAAAVLDRLEAAARESYVPRYGLAGLYAVLGRRDAALDALERSAEDRDGPLVWVTSTRSSARSTTSRATSAWSRTAWVSRRSPRWSRRPAEPSMDDDAYLADIRDRYRGLRAMADRAIEQVTDEQLFHAPDPLSNSIAVLMKHMAGNMRSRWRDFLTADGEKPDRRRDQEFEMDGDVTRADIASYWEEGWTVCLNAIDGLRPDDLDRTITIRGEPHSVPEALHRQLVHYAAHVGQIVYLAKHLRAADWRTLSIPRGESEAFLRRMREGDVAGYRRGVIDPES